MAEKLSSPLAVRIISTFNPLKRNDLWNMPASAVSQLNFILFALLNLLSECCCSWYQYMTLLVCRLHHWHLLIIQKTRDTWVDSITWKSPRNQNLKFYPVITHCAILFSLPSCHHPLCHMVRRLMWMSPLSRWFLFPGTNFGDITSLNVITATSYMKTLIMKD